MTETQNSESNPPDFQSIVRDEIKKFTEQSSRVFVDDSTQVQTLRKTAEEALSSIEASKTAIDNFVKEFEKSSSDFSTVLGVKQEALTQLADDFKRQHDGAVAFIQEAKKAIQPVAEEVQGLKNATAENAKVVQDSRSKVEVDTKTVAEHLTQTKSNADKSSLLLSESEKYRNSSLEFNEKIKIDGAKVSAILKTAEEKDKKVEEYEDQLSQLIKESAELRKQIEDLLPGAVSASLAKSFTDRKSEIAKPKWFWVGIQLVSILGFIGMGIYIFLHPEPATWKEWIILIIRKSPILVGLILLEEISRRNYNVAERLEEDYGYKAVLASSFIGYRDQMIKIDAGEANSTVTKLANNLLNSLGREPGKLIDKVKSVKRPPSDILDRFAENKNEDKPEKTS